MKVIKYGRLLVLWESGKSSEKMGHLTWGLSRNWPVRYGSGKTSLCIHLLPPRQQWPQDWKRSVFIPIPKKGNAKNAKTTAQLHSSHTLVKQWSKFSKPGFNSTWTVNFQMFKLDLEKVEEPEIKLPDFVDYQKNRTATKKKSISALLTMPKPLTVWITTNCGKFWKRWESQTTWPACWEICMQVRKHQLELDTEQ